MEEVLLVQDSETTPEPEYNFATIGDVYADGVSLIFDGATEPSDKHYLVNTSIVFHAGDRVKIAKDAGTYVCEYVVGAPGATAPHELPAGGAQGKVLKKKTATDYDVEWADETNDLPAGGSTGQVLAKSTNYDYAVSWKTVHEIPSGGAAGKFLKKKTAADYDVEWDDTSDASRAGALINQYNSGALYDLQFRTTAIYGSFDLQVRLGSSGTWKTITLS